MKSESEPPSTDAPKSGESPALVSEPVDQASHNDGEVDPPADETEAAAAADGETADAADGDGETAAEDGDAEKAEATQDGDAETAEAEAPNDPADANTGAAEENEGEAPVAEGSREWGAERLSAVEADALADSFRPSWETDWGADDSPPPAAGANSDAAASAIAAAPASRGFDEPTPVLVAKPAPISPPDDTDAVAAIIPGADTARRNLLIGAGVFIVAIVIIMAFMLSGDETADPSITNAPGESDPALADEAGERAEAVTDDEPEPEPEVAPEPEPEPEPEPVTYQLTVRTVPAGATLTLDGEAVPNPLTRTVEPDEADHQLLATADGYEDASTSVRFDGDRETVLTLEAEPPPAPVAMAEPPPSPMRTTRRSRRTAMRRTAMRQSRMRSRGAGFTTSNPY